MKTADKIKVALGTLLVMAGCLVLGMVLSSVIGPIVRTEPVACVEKTRVITESEKWASCDHPDHVLTETPLGYGRLKVACSCIPKRDAGSCTGRELTADEERVLLEAVAAGLLPPADAAAEGDYPISHFAHPTASASAKPRSP